MPNRWIRESARTSKNLNEVSDFAERLFWRLITTADDYGRFLACGSIVKAACFPLMDSIRVEKIDKALAELVDKCLIRLYFAGDRRYGLFLKWVEHQGAPRSKFSKYPDPADFLDDSQNLHTSANICTQMFTSASRNQHACAPSDSETDSKTSPNSLSLNSSSSNLNPDPEKSSSPATPGVSTAEHPTRPPSPGELWAQAEELLLFLNRKTGKHFQPRKPNKDPTVSLTAVHGLLKQGFTEEQVRKVIANRLLKWGDDPKMREYLRPDTLFRPSKFEQYLGELGVTHAMPNV
ncbi:MAG: conserved phage C-terminal domain-containing protein [Nitrospira sp.]|nr:conserved phage C-terminal domain-containing protein [Nitrospira sp.]